MKQNVYDFDKTIYCGDSTLDFFWFSLRRYPQVIVILPHFAFSLTLYLFGKCSKEDVKESFYRFLRYIPDVSTEVELFWQKKECRLFSWYLLQKQGNDIIISASPAFLLNPICEKLDVELIASNVNMNTGLYTGLNCYGEEKKRRLLALYPNFIIDCFYSDSNSDKPLAELAEKAYFVKNNRVTEWKHISEKGERSK